MGKIKVFFTDIKESKFKSLYIRNFLFAASIFIIVLFTAITFNDVWLNVIGVVVLLCFIYLTSKVRLIEQDNLYEEITGVITGYKGKAKADLLTPRLISEECSFIVETNDKEIYEIFLPRLELKTRGFLLQEGEPKYWIGRQITFYYRDDPSKPFHYDISKRKAESKDGKEDSEI